MLEVEMSAVINRPVEQVFAFVANQDNMPLWFVGCQEVALVEGDSVGEGSKVRVVGALLGKSIETIIACRGYEENRLIAWEMTQPFPQTISYGFESAGEGTRLTIRGAAEIGGFFKLATPIISGSIRRNGETSLANLKDILEAQ